jgi:gluconokinase
MKVPNLRSPHDKVGGIDYFGRLLDKVRLREEGTLPQDYIANLGEGFDQRCASFLGVDYHFLASRVLQGGSDQEILEWCFLQGHRPSEEQIEVWNEFMRKRGWNDAGSARLKERLAESGFENHTDIQTFFDYIDLDEERRS